MAIHHNLILLRISAGRHNPSQPPLALRTFALQVEAAEPRYVYYGDSTTNEEIQMLLLAALAAKVGNVASSYTLDPVAGEGVIAGHDIDAVDPGKWTDLGATARAVLHPLADGAHTYYLGAKL